jgi:hypothetical protein
MKHIKAYKLFESVENDINKFQEIFYEIEDIGFNVIIKYSKTNRISIIPDANKNEILNRQEISRFIQPPMEQIYVVITKNGPFNFSDIKETLLFAESYCVELGYKFEWILWYETHNSNTTYSGNINNVPDRVVRVAAFFSKIKEI